MLQFIEDMEHEQIYRSSRSIQLPGTTWSQEENINMCHDENTKMILGIRHPQNVHLLEEKEVGD